MITANNLVYTEKSTDISNSSLVKFLLSAQKVQHSTSCIVKADLRHTKVD